LLSIHAVIYISDISKTESKQYGYADDLALMYSIKDWNKVEKTLNTDLNLISEYLKTWRLKLSIEKDDLYALLPLQQRSRPSLQISLNGTPIRHDPYSIYLGVIVDRQLTFKKHCENTRAKAEGPIYTWRTLIGVKLNKNGIQYSSPEIFWQCNQGTGPELR